MILSNVVFVVFVVNGLFMRFYFLEFVVNGLFKRKTGLLFADFFRCNLLVIVLEWLVCGIYDEYDEYDVKYEYDEHYKHTTNFTTNFTTNKK